MYYGDCLQVVKQWPDELVDLIYLDPPFNSKSNYNILYGKGQPGSGSRAQVRAFEDTWSWGGPAADRVERLVKSSAHKDRSRLFEGLRGFLGESGMLSYLSYMAERMTEFHRIMKPTGSIYVHCDPTASHYLKLVMDAIFGKANFRNEIVWCYSTSGRSKRFFAKKHDIIFLYTKSKQGYWGDYRIPVSKKYLDSHYTQKDDQGRRCRIRVDAGTTRVYYPEDGMTCNDWWEIPYVNSRSKERRYPTQKPVPLLNRIIEASSKPGELVLDPFCGCGTTITAAHNLERSWLGIDISVLAIDVVLSRLEGKKVPVFGLPADYESAQRLAQDSWSEFERWAISQLGGVAPNDSQVSDGGIDGQGKIVGEPPEGLSSAVLAQVKGSKTVAKTSIRDFCHVVQREKAACGVFICLAEIPKGVHAEAAGMGTITIQVDGNEYSYPRVQCWSIASLFDDKPQMPALPLMTDPYTGRALARQQTFA